MKHTEEDVHCALHAQGIDNLVLEQYDGEKTPYQVIFWEEAQTFHDTLKDVREEWVETSPGFGEWILVQETWNIHNIEDRKEFARSRVRPSYQRYQRGKEILAGHKLVYSSRWMAGAGEDRAFHDMRNETMTSPAIVIGAGHVATTERFRWVALAERNTNNERV